MIARADAFLAPYRSSIAKEEYTSTVKERSGQKPRAVVRAVSNDDPRVSLRSSVYGQAQLTVKTALAKFGQFPDIGEIAYLATMAVTDAFIQFAELDKPRSLPTIDWIAQLVRNASYAVVRDRFGKRGDALQDAEHLSPDAERIHQYDPEEAELHQQWLTLQIEASRRRVTEALQKLDVKAIQVGFLYSAGLKTAEIAKQLGMTSANVRLIAAKIRHGVDWASAGIDVTPYAPSA